MYLDESGDHVYRKMATDPHRYLCLLGCWFKNPAYLDFHQRLDVLKSRHLIHHPDDPIVLHREEMINARGQFAALKNEENRAAFDKDLLQIIDGSQFTVVAVVIDKYELWRRLGESAPHPYELGLAFQLQRYVGFLNRINRVGDVMAEARGGSEDRRLEDEFTRLYETGTRYLTSHAIQQALTSRQLKLKQKRANISGLQLADLLGHPVKQWVLRKVGLIKEPLSPFAERLMETVEGKFNRHLSSDRVDGYGFVLYPKNRKGLE